MPVNVGTAYISVVPKLDASALSSVESAFKGSNIGGSIGNDIADNIKESVGGAGSRIGGELGDGITSGISSKSAAIAGVIGGITSKAISFLTDAIGSLTGQMVEAADGAQKFSQTLSFAGIDTSTIDALTKSTQTYADQTVYDLNDIRSVTAQLATNGVDNYAQLAEAAGNLNAVAGGNADTFRSVSLVMTQTAGAGKLTTENFNQLADAIPGASGMLQQAMKDAGAFEGNFRDAMAEGQISADEFFAAVQKLGMQDVAVQAATSTSTIEGALGNLEASVVGVGSQVVQAVTPMVTGAMTEISNFVSGIPSALAPVGEAIQTALSTGDTTDLGAAIGRITTSVITGASTAVQNLATQLPTIMQTALPIVIQAVSSFVQSVLRQLPELLMSLLGLVVSGISSFVSTVAAQLPTLLPQLAQAALSALNQLVTQLFTNIPTYVGQMVDAAVQLFNGIADAIPLVIPVVVQGIGDLVRNVLSNLPTYLTQMLSAAVELFTGIVDAIPKVVPSVLSGISDLLSDVWDAITSFDLVGAGTQLIQGLVDGIKNAGGAVLNAIGGVVSGAIDWAKGLLGIHSPSRVFREIGDFTMRGFALGVESAASDATKAMNAAMSDVYGTASKYSPAGLAPLTPSASYGVAGAGYAEQSAAEIGAALAGMGVYLDSGRLVGGISRDMNRSLGRIQRRGSLA